MLPDYYVQLIAPDGTGYNITDRLETDSLRTSLVIERNLHEFRAGDLQVILDDGDGFLSDLFSGLLPEDRWKLRIFRDGVSEFFGVVVPIDSLSFDVKQKVLQLTAVDLSKALDDLDAAAVTRPATAYALASNASAGATSLTLNTTANLYNGDELQLTEGFSQETVTIALVSSTTVVKLEQATGAAYTTGATVTLRTPFYRFQTPTFLINALLNVAAPYLTGRNVDLDGPPWRFPIFSPQSTKHIPDTTMPDSLAQIGGQQRVMVSGLDYQQATPAGAWSAAATGAWQDWGPYRSQAEGEPDIPCTCPVSSGSNGPYDPDYYGFAYIGAVNDVGFLARYRVGVSSNQAEIVQFSTSDGTTWSGPSGAVTIVSAGSAIQTICGDYDRRTNRYYYAFRTAAGSVEFGYYDYNTSTKTVLSSTDDVSGPILGMADRFWVMSASNFNVQNIRVSYEGNAILLYNHTQKRIEAWRGDAMIWSYDGPYAANINVKQIRYINGAWVACGFEGNVPTAYYSTDNFATVVAIPLDGPTTAPASNEGDARLAIVNGSIRICIRGAGGVARYFVGAPFYTGIVPYADFSDMSVSEALGEMAMILNCVFVVDQEGVARFILRDNASGTPPVTLDSLVLERSDVPIWVETYDYVEVSSPGGVPGTAGTKTAVSRNLSVSSRLPVGSGAATAIAWYLYDFFSRRRRHAEVKFDDSTGVDLELMDQVMLDGIPWLVYQADRELADYSGTLLLIEQVS